MGPFQVKDTSKLLEQYQNILDKDNQLFLAHLIFFLKNLFKKAQKGKWTEE